MVRSCFMGRVVFAFAVVLAGIPRGTAEGRAIYSRADLLAGAALHRFASFDGRESSWSGAGKVEGGLLRIDAAEGEWEAVWGRPGGIHGVAVYEWEAMRLAGPPESEWAFLVGAGGRKDAGLRIHFSGEGSVRIERFGPEGRGTLAGPAAATGLFPSGWIRAAVRIGEGRIAVVVGGEEALTAELPAAEWNIVGLAAGPGSSIGFDHVAYHSSASRRGPERAHEIAYFIAETEDGIACFDMKRAPFFEGFARDRDIWAEGRFSVRNGVLPVVAAKGEPVFDLLDLPFPDVDWVVAAFSVEGPGPADFLVGARSEGDDFQGRVFRIDPEGKASLLVRRGGADRPVRGTARKVDLRSGWNDLAIRFASSSAEIFLNGKYLFRAEPVKPGFGVRAAPGAAFALDHLILAGGAAEDSARARSAWRAAKTLAARGDREARVERLREMALALPDLPGAYDLLFREAAIAGEIETALAAAASRCRFGEHGTDWVLALLLARRWEEARGKLARLRAAEPEDPFGVENTLLLLDRLGERERLTREYRAARAGVEPLRASSHGVAAWAYLREGMTAEAAEALAEAFRLGPGRWDLEVVEADLLRARGDTRSALARYGSLLGRGLPSSAEKRVRARLALSLFESGDFRRAAEELASLPPDENERTERVRRILRAVAMSRRGEAEQEAGRAGLLEARALAESTLADPPASEDAILFDLLGRIESSIALLDFREDGNYRAYREAERRAERFHARAAALDPRFAPVPGAAGTEPAALPAPDPGRYAALIVAALPDDHPVGGFTEDPQRWASWRAVDRRADLAERAIEKILGP